MADPKGFLKVKRERPVYRPVCERVKDFREVNLLRSEENSTRQASRCMDCGTPFCHWACPVGNFIPEWNDMVFKGRWERAYELLSATNNFPEVTGRVCPALCEYSCVLGINDDPVTIRENELDIIERAFMEGYVQPEAPEKRTGRKVAIVGSGPAGLACADQLNKAGHLVTVFERDDAPGGIMRYGIPDFKLDKSVLDRRIDIMRRGGVIFETGKDVGVDVAADRLEKDFDAVCLAGGSRVPRDLKIEGRELGGIHFAMDFLIQSNRRIKGEDIRPQDSIDANGKRVVVIGGGDTGADCVGVSHRQGAACVVQIEVLPQPPGCRTEACPWPYYPMLLKTSTSHEEGGQRMWSVLTKKFTGKGGRVKKLHCVKVEFDRDKETGRPQLREIRGTDFEIDTDLVILAIGFLHPEHGLPRKLGIELDNRGNLRTDANYMTSRKGFFSAGDMRRGQSLIVRAISEGRRAAYCIDKYLIGSSNLPVL